MISAGTVFTNDRFPRATVPDLSRLRPSEPDEHTRPTLVREGATIGAGSVIGCDLVVGRWSMVGMGSVITRSVPDFHLVVGRPARSVGCVCRCGEPFLRFDRGAPPDVDIVACGACGLRYAVHGGRSERARAAGVGRIHRRTRRRASGERRPPLGDRRRRDAGPDARPSLRQHGDDVTVFEAAPYLGGLASAWSLDEVVWDRHYHVTLLSDSHLRATALRAGTRAGHEVGRNAHRMLYRRASCTRYRTASSFCAFHRSRSSTRSVWAATILYGSKVRNWQRLENVTVEQWLTTWSGRRDVRALLVAAAAGEAR